MSKTGPHVSISAETLFHVGDFAVTNSIFVSLIVSILLLTFFVAVRTNLKSGKKIGKLQNFTEFLYETIFDFIDSVTGDKKKTKFFLPFFMSFFLFIVLNNWLGLLPGVGTIGIKTQEKKVEEKKVAAVEAAFFEDQEHVEEIAVIDEHAEEIVDTHAEEVDEHATETAAVTDEGHGKEDSHGSKIVPLLRPGTADLNTTIALAIVSVFLTQVFGIKYLGLAYFKKFFNFSNPINAFVGILEIISEFAKIISFAFRLFGNVFAGEVLLSVISFLIPVVVPMPFYGLEIFVGLIQALVFAVLSLVFFNMATHSHESH